jgi:hypothetical protein
MSRNGRTTWVVLCWSACLSCGWALEGMAADTQNAPTYEQMVPRAIDDLSTKGQAEDGSRVNQNDRWREGDPNLLTGNALLALAYCKPRP